ncbi:hypothetical protein chiPu_0002302 [Chiloscyllium punctatum]|uniref:Uncharacterized protein n=1 Tax=Chiloscyllium punctatum TaxID=137246 RepID=A0A401S0G9_CHIPU|nr:hypothetical protein [Chiloscyllium punctatum]
MGGKGVASTNQWRRRRRVIRSWWLAWPRAVCGVIGGRAVPAPGHHGPAPPTSAETHPHTALTQVRPFRHCQQGLTVGNVIGEAGATPFRLSPVPSPSSRQQLGRAVSDVIGRRPHPVVSAPPPFLACVGRSAT